MICRGTRVKGGAGMKFSSAQSIFTGTTYLDGGD